MFWRSPFALVVYFSRVLAHDLPKLPFTCHYLEHLVFGGIKLSLFRSFILLMRTHISLFRGLFICILVSG